MRISDWSSDVCSSDLPDRGADSRAGAAHLYRRRQDRIGAPAHHGTAGNAVAQATLLAGRVRRLEPPDALSVAQHRRAYFTPPHAMARLRLRLDAPHYGL